MMNRLGQVLSEFMLTTLLVLLPLLGGGVWWFKLEWNRSKCAYETFFKARQQLIASRQWVDYRQTCGTITEKIQLTPLEELDQNKGALDFQDAIQEASQLWEHASQSWSSSPQLDSTESFTESGI